jgi:hypothetical protein
LFFADVKAIIGPIKTTITGLAAAPNPKVDPLQAEGSHLEGVFHSGRTNFLVAASRQLTAAQNDRVSIILASDFGFDSDFGFRISDLTHPRPEEQR